MKQIVTTPKRPEKPTAIWAGFSKMTLQNLGQYVRHVFYDANPTYYLVWESNEQKQIKDLELRLRLIEETLISLGTSGKNQTSEKTVDSK